MLFFLRKLVEALLLPIGISGILTIAGILFRRRWMAVAGVITLYAFSMPVVGRLMTRSLERVYQPTPVAAAPNADAIVVLSGAIVRGISAPGVQWGDASNRYFAGFDLAVAGKAKVLIISAGLPNSLGPSEGVILRQTALNSGIQPERILLTRSVLTTADEAQAISEIPNVHSVLLVTSAFHMPRAVLLFRARGLTVLPFPTDQRVLGRRTLTPSALVPDAGSLHTSEQAMREYYGLAVYRVVLLFRPAGF